MDPLVHKKFENSSSTLQVLKMIKNFDSNNEHKGFSVLDYFRSLGKSTLKAIVNCFGHKGFKDLSTTFSEDGDLPLSQLQMLSGDRDADKEDDIFLAQL